MAFNAGRLGGKNMKEVIDNVTSYLGLTETQIADYARGPLNDLSPGALARAGIEKERLSDRNIEIADELSTLELAALELAQRDISTLDGLYGDPEMVAFADMYNGYVNSGYSEKQSIEKAHDAYASTVGDATAKSNIDSGKYNTDTGQWRDSKTDSKDRLGNTFDGPSAGYEFSDQELENGIAAGNQDLNGLDQQAAALEAEVDAKEAAEEAASQPDSGTGTGDSTGTDGGYGAGVGGSGDGPEGGNTSDGEAEGAAGNSEGGSGGPGEGGGIGLPIALDLDGDGLELVASEESTVSYDLNDDGYREVTGWVGADDGILAFDKDSDGDITDTDEISFVGYKEGATTDLEGLAAFDSNGDGQLNAADDSWSQFGVWQDVDQDGEVDSGEFQSLDAIGIESIGFSSDGVTQQQDGNIVYGTGSYSRTDGTTAALGDVGLGYVDPEAVTHSLDDPRSAILEATNHTDDNASASTAILGTSNNNNLTAGGQDSVFIYGGDGSDQMAGSDGHDVLIGGAGADSYNAGAGNDIIGIDSADASIDGGSGVDAVYVLNQQGVSLDLGASNVEIAVGNSGNDNFSTSTAGAITLKGMGGNDSLTGNSGADLLVGGAGNDSLTGGGGDDVLIGGSGTDSLSGGAGHDTLVIDADDMSINGGAGFDIVLVADSRGVSLDLGQSSIEMALGNSGNDQFSTSGSSSVTLDGGEGHDNLLGSGSADHLYGGLGNDSLSGNGGDDLLVGGTGSDAFSGGAGDDTLVIDASDQQANIDGGTGNDTVWVNDTSGVSFDLGAANVEAVVGDSGNDQFGTSTTSAIVADGAAGDDQLSGNAAADTLLGGDGNDTLIGNGGDDLLSGDAGSDTLQGGAGDDLLGIDADDLQMNLDGGVGNDTAIVSDARGVSFDLGAAQVETAIGNAGNDQFNTTTEGAILVDGGGGDDLITGGAGADTLIGSDGNDSLIGNDGDDLLRGGAGSDTLISGAGDDTLAIDADDLQANLDGGAGEDTVVVNDARGVSFDLGAANVEIAIGYDGNDQFSTSGDTAIVVDGAAGDDLISGGAAEDILLGGNGSDTLVGNGGDDLLVGDAGSDTLLGGDGNDVLGIDADDLQANLDGGVGDDAAIVNDARAVTFDLGAANVETAIGNDGNDQFSTSTAGSIMVDGRSGDDFVSGSGGDDSLLGGLGNDTLIGNAGDDVLIGDLGSDTLFGGEGSDFLGIDADDLQANINGGAGDDTVVVSDERGVSFDLGLANVENALGHSGDDQFSTSAANAIVVDGAEGNDLISGGLAGDSLLGGEGNDTLIGNAGDDLVIGGVGADTLLGGEGDDILGIDTEDLQANLDGGAGNDTAVVSDERGVSFDLGAANVENAVGNVGNDQFSTSTSGAIVVDGGAGEDLLAGGAGDDVLLGGGDNDTLTGNDGDDLLMGDAGSDTFSGGAGNDILGIDADDLQANIDGGSGEDTVIVSDERGVAFDLGAAQVENAVGNAGNDQFSTSTDGAIVVDGGLGSDLLAGGAGDDMLLGNDGDDSLSGNDGGDLLMGDAGSDTFSGGAGDDILGIDADDLQANIDGGVGDDSVMVTDERAVTFDLGAANVENAFGNAGDDQFSTSTEGAVIVGGAAGNDLIAGNAGDDLLLGNDGDDSLIGNGGADLLMGDAGSDTFSGGLGDDTLGIDADDLQANIDGGADDDTAIVSDERAVTFDLGAANVEVAIGNIGDDQFSTSTDIDILVDGAAGDDQISGAGGNDVLLGGEGSDALSGNSGDDWLHGGRGADQLDGGAGTDTAFYSDSDAAVQVSLTSGVGTGGDAEGDTLTGIEDLVGSDWSDHLVGNVQSNRLEGEQGDDHLEGMAGDDWLNGGAGADLIDGGKGIDTASYEGSDSGVEVYLTTGAGTVGDAAGDSLISIENLYGSEYDDRLIGDAGDNRIDGYLGNDHIEGLAGDDHLLGNQGNDHLDGGLGNDLLEGGAGNDWLIGGSGVDTLDGGDGRDTADYSWSTKGGFKVDLVEGTTAGADARKDTLLNIENVKGTAKVDFIYGDSGSNTLDGHLDDDNLYGREGDDLLIGGEGHDNLYGGDGNDQLAGGTGMDRLYGEAGNDALEGAGGIDWLYGGNGNDTLEGGAGDDHLFGGAGEDTFLFSRGDGVDRIGVAEGYDLPPADQGTGPLETDQLVFGESINANELWFERIGQDLEIDLLGSDDHISLEDWFTTEGERVGSFELSSGETLVASNVQQLVDAMAGFDAGASDSETSGFNQAPASVQAVIATSWEAA